MQAWQLQNVPSNYMRGEVADPDPSAGEVIVKVSAFGLNHLDQWLADGKPRPKSFPHVSGADGVGTVHEIGEAVTNVSVGDQVVINPLITCGVCNRCVSGRQSLCENLSILGEQLWGTFGELVKVPAKNVVARPEGISDDIAASYGLVTMTALHMLRRSGLASNERVLITGVGGGVAQALFSLCKQRNIDVSVTSRSESKIEVMKARGASAGYVNIADAPVNTFDVVFDSVGQSLWPDTFNLLNKGGRFVTCGGTGGMHLDIPLAQLFWKQRELIGVTMGDFSDFEEATRLVAGGLALAIQEVVPFSELPRAMALLSSGRQLGKVVVSHLG